jgi:hypothetical protein
LKDSGVHEICHGRPFTIGNATGRGSAPKHYRTQ